MRILQLIDSLNPGGAERMAINYFEVLKNYSIKSFLVVTRQKGLLAKEIKTDPNFYFLNKKHSLDFRALLNFRKIIYEHKIDIVHAHGTSWFFAVLCKFTGVRFKLIWHDHYGNSNFIDQRSIQPLRFFSSYFDGIIVVNKALRNWALNNLRFKRTIKYIPNFIRFKKGQNDGVLEGGTEFNIICIANLRRQKDHSTLLKSFEELQKQFSVSLHLFGKGYGDSYSKYLKKEFLSIDNVYYYGEIDNVFPYICKADIGVLSSVSEGLPLALLEYSMAGIAVVCTDVGECRNVTGNNARLIKAGSKKEMIESIAYYLERPDILKRDGAALKEQVAKFYSEASAMDEYLKFIEEI